MRPTLLTSVLLGLIVTVSLLTAPGVPAAQEATPPGEAAPIILESLGSAPSPDAPGMQLALLRATIAPGVVAPPHVHPGQLIVAVESGSVAYTILDEEGESGRGRFGTPTATEAIPPRTEVMLGPGEWIIEEPGIVHTFRNPGNEPLVLLVSALIAPNEPFLQPVDIGMATPAA
jgi:quercetin dioxygenase-like cupin family protein